MTNKPNRVDPLISNNVYDIVVGVFEPFAVSKDQNKWVGCLYADVKGRNTRILLQLSKKDSEEELDIWVKKMIDEKLYQESLNQKLLELNIKV